MVHIIIGAVLTAFYFQLIQYSRRKQISPTWWQWGLTLTGFLFALFVCELIVSFAQEGAVRGAIVIGVLLGFIAVLWGVLLGRFIFSKKGKQA